MSHNNEADLIELQRQNELLRGANKVLREALATVVDKYKEVALASRSTKTTGSPAHLPRVLPDVSSAVFVGVQERLSQDPISPRQSSPRNHCRDSLERRDLLMEVARIIDETGVDAPKQERSPIVSRYRSVCRPDQSDTDS